jgi:hypothetical protein
LVFALVVTSDNEDEDEDEDDEDEDEDDEDDDNDNASEVFDLFDVFTSLPAAALVVDVPDKALLTTAMSHIQETIGKSLLDSAQNLNSSKDTLSRNTNGFVLALVLVLDAASDLSPATSGLDDEVEVVAVVLVVPALVLVVEDCPCACC